jgi:hypothetical protein
MKKVLSVVLLLLGAFILLLAVEITVFRSATGKSPDNARIAMYLPLGGVLSWGGAVLWNQWRMAAGIISIFHSVGALGRTIAFHDLATKAGPDADMYRSLSHTWPVVAALLLVLGLVLIIAQVRRNKAKSRTLEGGGADA